MNSNTEALKQIQEIASTIGHGSPINAISQIIEITSAALSTTPSATGERLSAEGIMGKFKLHDGSLSCYKAYDVEQMLNLALSYASQSTPSAATQEAFIPCQENDPAVCGSYTSTDGQSLCYVKRATQEVKEDAETAAMNNCVCKTGDCVHYKSFMYGVEFATRPQSTDATEGEKE